MEEEIPMFVVCYKFLRLLYEMEWAQRQMALVWNVCLENENGNAELRMMLFANLAGVT